MPTSPSRAPGSAAATPLSRRALLGTGLASGATLLGLSATGCSSEEQQRKAPRTATPSPAPDVAVATTALEAIRRVHAGAVSTARRFPKLERELAPLTSMHAAHEDALADAVPERAQVSGTPGPYVVPRRRKPAARALRRAEEQLHRDLDALALRAQSGDFARLLAAMGAGVAQHLEVWT